MDLVPGDGRARGGRIFGRVEITLPERAHDFLEAPVAVNLVGARAREDRDGRLLKRQGQMHRQAVSRHDGGAAGDLPQVRLEGRPLGETVDMTAVVSELLFQMIESRPPLSRPSGPRAGFKPDEIGLGGRHAAGTVDPIFLAVEREAGHAKKHVLPASSVLALEPVGFLPAKARDEAHVKPRRRVVRVRQGSVR